MKIPRPVSPEVFALVKKHEAIVTHKKFTVDGEVYVCRKGTAVFDLPLEIIDVEKAPEGIKDRHKTAMNTLYLMVQQIKPLGRQVPVTRRELIENGVPKKDLVFLEKTKLIRIVVVPITHSQTGKATKPAHCVYFTELGRAFVRDILGHKDYGREGHGEWESVREHAEEIRKRWAAEERGLREDSVPS